MTKVDKEDLGPESVNMILTAANAGKQDSAASVPLESVHLAESKWKINTNNHQDLEDLLTLGLSH